MLAKDTTLIFFNKVHKNIQDVLVGDKVKTKVGDRFVTEVLSKKEQSKKLIFSDGYKVILTDSQEFLLPSFEWKKVKDLKEGDLVAKPDNTSAKLVDITELDKIQGYNIMTEDNNGFLLSNGMMVR